MIRNYAAGDLDFVMQIWLDTNRKAHDFIPSHYWHSCFDLVKELLPSAALYVYENDDASDIAGFIGLNGSDVEGLFVKDTAQSNGIGKQLLDYAKSIKDTLRLHVYQKNERAIRFYQRENFIVQSEAADDRTGEHEFVMVWNKTP